MDYTEIKGWVDAARGSLALLVAAKDALPKGKQRDEIEPKLVEADGAMKRSDARLAKELGMKLC
jgi:hypothetical protein